MEIPVEILCQIVSDLDIVSAHRFCNCSKTCQRILDNSNYWRCKVSNLDKLSSDDLAAIEKCELKTYMWFRDFSIRFDSFWELFIHDKDNLFDFSNAKEYIEKIMCGVDYRNWCVESNIFGNEF